MTWERLYTLKRKIKETQEHELLYHRDAQRCSHHSSLSTVEPFVPLSKVSLCFLEWAGSLSPSCRKCKRTSWKATVYIVPEKVRGELPSHGHRHHLLSPQTFLQWWDHKCFSYRYWSSCSQRSRAWQLGRTFPLVALPWLIYYVTLETLYEGLFWKRWWQLIKIQIP